MKNKVKHVKYIRYPVCRPYYDCHTHSFSMQFFSHSALATPPTGSVFYFIFFFTAIYVFSAFISCLAGAKWNQSILRDATLISFGVADLCTNHKCYTFFSAPDEEHLLLAPNSKALQTDRQKESSTL